MSCYKRQFNNSEPSQPSRRQEFARLIANDYRGTLRYPHGQAVRTDTTLDGLHYIHVSVVRERCKPFICEQ